MTVQKPWCSLTALTVILLTHDPNHCPIYKIVARSLPTYLKKKNDQDLEVGYNIQLRHLHILQGVGPAHHQISPIMKIQLDQLYRNSLTLYTLII